MKIILIVIISIGQFLYFTVQQHGDIFSSALKKEYIKVEQEPYPFILKDKIKKYKIRVYNQDLKLYEKYISLLRKDSIFYKSQIEDYIKDFEKKIKNVKK